MMKMVLCVVLVKENSSTHHPCRWGSTDQARTLGPHTLSEDRLPQSTAPRHWAHIDISHMETPGESRTNIHSHPYQQLQIHIHLLNNSFLSLSDFATALSVYNYLSNTNIHKKKTLQLVHFVCAFNLRSHIHGEVSLSSTSMSMNSSF